MEASLVRAYLAALPDVPPDGRSVPRVRYCLEALTHPDLRYLVAAIVGSDAPAIARVASAVLRAAGARTAILGGSLEACSLDGAPIDDALLAEAGTLAASAGYQLADSGRDLGQLSRREASVLLALTAFAQANERVALLLDTDVVPADASHAPVPDLTVLGALGAGAAGRALDLVPEGRPLVATALAEDVRRIVEDRASASGTPLLLGGRDHHVEERDGRLVLLVRDDPYVTFDAVPGIDRSALATGIATALALGVMGIRMREEWVLEALARLREEPVPA